MSKSNIAENIMPSGEGEELGYQEFVRAKVKAGLESAAKGPHRSLDEVAARVKEKIRKIPRAG
jgi:predicted transcriptional regulator